MGKLNIKGGTPVGSASLCRTCTSAHLMTGFRESEFFAICTDVHPNIPIPFPIHECTGYYDKNRPNWEQMQKLAIKVEDKALKPVGFRTVAAGFLERTEPIPDEGDEEEETDHE